MDLQLTHSLIFLVWSSAVMVILIGIFVIKVLFDLSRLAGTVNNTAEIVKNELEPALKNISETVEIISIRVKETDDTITKVETSIKNVARQGRKTLSLIGGGIFAFSKLVFRGTTAFISSKLK